MIVPSRDEALVAAAKEGDAQAMFEIGTRSEERARDLLVYAREALRRGADAGSLDAVHAVVASMWPRESTRRLSCCCTTPNAGTRTSSRTV